MKKCGIYRITNIKNGKIYWGSSEDIDTRWSKHKSHLRGNYHPNAHLQNSWNKWGEDSFEFKVFALCDPGKLLNTEQHILDEFVGLDCCFNIAVSATAPMTGRVHTEETKAQYSIDRTGEGNPMYGVSRYGEENPFYGKSHTEEAKKKISEARRGTEPWNKGTPMSKEAKRKISEAKTGKPSLRKGVPAAKLTCPHCNKTGGNSNMRRYHFDNCKQKGGRSPLQSD